jgi:phosphomannomutase
MYSQVCGTCHHSSNTVCDLYAYCFLGVPGNEIGVILGHWQITKWKEQGGSDGAAVLASVVSSRMLKHIAKCEGMQYYDTLTGKFHITIHDRL